MRLRSVYKGIIPLSLILPTLSGAASNLKKLDWSLQRALNGVWQSEANRRQSLELRFSTPTTGNAYFWTGQTLSQKKRFRITKNRLRFTDGSVHLFTVRKDQLLLKSVPPSKAIYRFRRESQ